MIVEFGVGTSCLAFLCVFHTDTCVYLLGSDFYQCSMVLQRVVFDVQSVSNSAN